MSDLGEMYRQCAVKCRADGVALDAESCGAIHRWVVANMKLRAGTEFFIVTGIASAMADLQAQDDGYSNQLGKAVSIAFNRRTHNDPPQPVERLRPLERRSSQE